MQNDTYKNIKSEHQLRSLVFDDYFKSKDISWEQELDKIDFIITGKQSRKAKEGGSEKHYFWAETKKSETDEYLMLTQLLLTIKKPYDKNEYIIPNYLGCFDTVKIIFVPTKLFLGILHDNDVKWNIAPNDIKNEYFLKLISKLKFVLFNNPEVKTFNFGTQDEEIKDFIKNNVLKGDTENKFSITEHNFDRVYLKWVDKVKPSIACNWEEEKKNGLLDADFFLADLLSKDDLSFKNKLLIVLQKDHYQLIKAMKKSKVLIEDDEYFFKDKQKAYKAFWSIYERPPLPVYWDNIINRKDLLVPQDIRERKGSFFTPQIWVEKSQEYLADVFGQDWQEKYYVWDCCAGTGNLLVGINRKLENVYASTIDESDVKAMYDRIENGARLLKKNVFQFDFLNDDFKKLPKSLKDIIDDPEKRKKLIIYINPPYAEVSSKDIKGKVGVNQSKVHTQYGVLLGTAGRELFSQFIMRIYSEIKGCKIGEFSTLKILNGPAFENFRNAFRAKLLKCFIMPANTFDNVNGQFPTGFKIWDTDIDEIFKKIKSDIYDKDSNFIGVKTFKNVTKNKIINNWISEYKKYDENPIGYMDGINGNDFQHNNIVYILNSKELCPNPRGIWITKENLHEICIYFTVRHIFEHTWINHNDQFLYPNDNYKNDISFINDCFVFTLFHTKNSILSKHGANHWIPFTEKELKTNIKFDSHFMSNFIAGEIITKNGYDLFEDGWRKESGRLEFSPEAKDVFEAGKELWKYYLGKPRVNIDASFYDIRLYFQGETNGRMNNTSDDEEYNTLIGNLREKMKILSEKIQPKVYEYGFLLK